MSTDWNLLDVEPDDDVDSYALQKSNGEIVVGEEVSSVPAIASVMPENFPLLTLLRFIPDVKLKKRADAASARVTEALAHATEYGALTRIEEARLEAKEAIDEIDVAFDDVVKLANQLHKRLTGLRSDFQGAAVGAVALADRALIAEKRRLDAIAETARREAQEAANKQMREAAEKAAAEAAKRKAPASVVAEMKASAKTIVAPPVPTPASASSALVSSSLSDKYKARLLGTTDDQDPNPDVVDMTPAQRESFVTLLAAVRGDLSKLHYLAVNWKVLNAIVKVDKKTFEFPGIEPFNEGSLRSKGRR